MDMSEVLFFDESLRVASADEVSNLRKVTYQKFPFFEYAVQNTFHHSDAAEEYDISRKKHSSGSWKQPFQRVKILLKMRNPGWDTTLAFATSLRPEEDEVRRYSSHKFS
jgi:hypothetical protein